MNILRNRLRLNKTRSLIKDLIDKERVFKIGRPTSDNSINESVKEIEKLERRYIIYRDSFWILTFATILTLLSLITK